MNDFEAIKQQEDIARFITKASGAVFKNVGSVLRANPCPICEHNDCFTVWPAARCYKCYSCDSAGNIFNFVEDYFRIIDHYQILVKAAELANYNLQNSQDIKKDSAQITRHKDIFNRAAEWYHNNLLNSKTVQGILAKTRTYTIDTIKEFKLGYSGESWTGLYDFLKKDFNDEALLVSGLVKHRKFPPQAPVDTELRDHFCPKMIIYPHFKGRQASDFTCKDAFKSRKKDPKDIVAPYRLQAEKRLDDVTFFNGNATYHADIIITEGQDDAIQFMRHLGSKNVLAITGNLSKKEMDILHSRVNGRKVFLAFDRDDAGLKYTQQFFLALWNSADQVRIVDWDPTKGKDVDEFLRNAV